MSDGRGGRTVHHRHGSSELSEHQDRCTARPLPDMPEPVLEKAPPHQECGVPDPPHWSVREQLPDEPGRRRLRRSPTPTCCGRQHQGLVYLSRAGLPDPARRTAPRWWRSTPNPTPAVGGRRRSTSRTPPARRCPVCCSSDSPLCWRVSSPGPACPLTPFLAHRRAPGWKVIPGAYRC